jgi:hypothetical protein
MAVVTSGLLAGQMLAIGLANLANRGQPEAEWTRRFQFENALFTKTMPVALMGPPARVSHMLLSRRRSWARAFHCGDRDDVGGAGDNPDR